MTSLTGEGGRKKEVGVDRRCFGGKGGWGLVVVDTVSSFRGGAISPNLGGGSNCIPKSGGALQIWRGHTIFPNLMGCFGNLWIVIQKSAKLIYIYIYIYISVLD